MTPTEAAELAMLAKGLWQRIGDPLRTEIGRVLLPFENKLYAEQLIRRLSHELEDFSLKALQDGLDAEDTRRREAAIKRQLDVTEAQRKIDARRAAEKAQMTNNLRSVDDLLNSLDDTDLATLKADVVTSFPIPCLINGDPKTNTGLRRLMHYRLTNGQAQPRAEVAVSSTIAQDFEV